MQKKILHTPKAPAAIGPYSQGVRLSLEPGSQIFYFSGQVALNATDPDLVSTDVEGQTKQVMQNIHNLLHSAELDFGNIVKTTIFLASMDDFQKVNAIYETHFTEAPPARSTVAVSTLPKNALVEIEVIAAC